MAYEKAEIKLYNYVTRKVFDAHQDRADRRRLRDKEEVRADTGHLLKKIVEFGEHLVRIQHELEELREHVAQHCLQLDDDRITTLDREELE